MSQVLTSLKSSDENCTAHFLFDLSSVLMPSAFDFVPTNLWGSAVWLQKKGSFFLAGGDYCQATVRVGCLLSEPSSHAVCSLATKTSNPTKQKKKSGNKEACCYKKECISIMFCAFKLACVWEAPL